MGYCIVYLHLSFIVVSLLVVTNFSTFKQSDELTWFPLCLTAVASSPFLYSSGPMSSPYGYLLD